MGYEMDSKDGGEDDECDLSHESLSEGNDVSEGFHHDNVRIFVHFHLVSSNVTACVFRRRKC